MARGFALVRTRDQWVRMAHDHTGIDPDTGGVRLAWTVPPVGGEMPAPPPPDLPGGLAFDSACVLYRSAVPEGRVERLLWQALDPFQPPTADSLLQVDLLGGEPEPPLGQFASDPHATLTLRRPLGLAVDEDDRLFVCEHGLRRLLVYDLPSKRLLRRVRFSAAPLDVAAAGRRAYLVLDGPPWLVRLSAREDPVPVPLPAAPGAPTRVAVSPAGTVFLLFRDAAGGHIVALDESLPVHDVVEGRDLEVQSEGQIVVACRPGDAFVRLTASEGTWSTGDPYAARDYDGYGIVRTPDGRIGFWTVHGFREAVLARVCFERVGRVSTYQLDGGEFQTEWGRVFLDACVPAGTRVRVHCATSDETLDDEPTLAWTTPEGFDGTVWRPDLTPPLPPLRFVPEPGDNGQFHPAHRRESGRELPWARPAADDPFETYEAPVIADPGRYLWVTLELNGNTRSSPRVKSIRAERPGHDLLRRLPKVYSRDPDVAAFLRRYLALLEGTVEELLDKAEARDILLDPFATPEELLPWLASFLGLAVDERWPTSSVRDLLADAGALLRCRGTKVSLEQFIDLYLGLPVATILEHWRLRGLGGAVLLDEPSALEAGTVVGETFRVGGALGERDAETLSGTVEDAFATHAHRFTVIIQQTLSPEQQDVISHILDVHRPAHTLFDLCTVGSGMRVGLGLHVGLLSIIGRTGGWEQLHLGGLLGRSALLGTAQSGMRVGDTAPGRVA